MLQVWPWLRYVFCCLKKQKTSFLSGLKHSLRHKLGIKVSKSDRNLEEDPYLRLGYGLNAFFNLLCHLLLLILLCSLITVPLLMIFARFDALENKQGYLSAQFSLGNLGGANVICV